MLVHPTKQGFNVLNNDGSAYGKRLFVIVTDARFIIDKELQEKSVADGDRLLIHAWCVGYVVAAQFNTVPSEQSYDGWCEVSYRPTPGAQFMRRGQAVAPTDVFPIVVCTRYGGRSVVLTLPEKSSL